MLRSSLLFSFIVVTQLLFSQAILLDEAVTDWTSDITVYDDANDNSRLDLLSLAIADDINAIYLKLEVDEEILLQNDNNISLTLIHENSILSFNFGERNGSFRNNGFIEVFHTNIGLVVSPTVSSKVFEIKIDKRWRFDNITYELEGEIELSIANASFNGDEIPNNGSISYTLTEDQIPAVPSYSLEKVDGTDFRFCGYNVLFDRIFESATRTEYGRILSAINPDIICFQEIYDNTAQQTQNRLLNVFNALDNTQTWYNSKRGSDNILISRYPIIYERDIAGNGVFVVEMDGHEVMIVNIHLPCCSRDSDREDEIDAILSFIRDSKNGNSNYLLKENSPIIINGDANFVGNADQVEALISGTIFNNNISGADFQIDWDDDGLTDLKPFATGYNTMHTFYNPFGSYSKGRLDYTFYSDYTLTALNSFVLDTDGLSLEELRDYDLEPYYTNYASDHYPVVIDFKLNELVATNGDNSLIQKVWPNPTSDYINIGNSDGRYAAELYNNSGRLVFCSESNRINLSSLPSGLYFLKTFNLSGRTAIQKIVKVD